MPAQRSKLKKSEPATCDICNKTISRGTDMTRHKRLHSKEEHLLLCPWPGCGHKTLQSSNLETHYRTHTKEKACQCPNCPRAYTDPGSLTRHRVRSHGHEPKGRKQRDQSRSTSISSTRGPSEVNGQTNNFRISVTTNSTVSTPDSSPSPLTSCESLPTTSPSTPVTPLSDIPISRASSLEANYATTPILDSARTAEIIPRGVTAVASRPGAVTLPSISILLSQVDHWERTSSQKRYSPYHYTRPSVASAFPSGAPCSDLFRYGRNHYRLPAPPLAGLPPPRHEAGNRQLYPDSIAPFTYPPPPPPSGYCDDRQTRSSPSVAGESRCTVPGCECGP